MRRSEYRSLSDGKTTDAEAIQAFQALVFPIPAKEETDCSITQFPNGRKNK